MDKIQYVVKESSGKVLGHILIVGLYDIKVKVGSFKGKKGHVVSLAFEELCENDQIADLLIVRAGIKTHYRLKDLN
jgi:hypothetical protein